MIVNAGSGDVGVAEPFLHLGDVGLMIERVGGGSRAQRVGADLEAEESRIGPHEPVNPVGCERGIEPASGVVLDRAEQGAVQILAVASGFEVIVDQLVRAGVQRR